MLVLSYSAPHGNARSGQPAFGGPVAPGRSQLELITSQQQFRSQSAGPQGQGQLHRRGPAPANPHRRMPARREPPIEPGQKRLQRFHPLDRASLDGARRNAPAGLAAHVEAEHVETQWGPPLELQFVVHGIEAADLRLHKAHPSAAAQLAQIDRTGLTRHQPRHQCRHHPRIVGGAAAVHQGHRRGGGPGVGPHDPAAQQQGVGMAAPGQHEHPQRRLGLRGGPQGSVHVQLTVVIPGQQRRQAIASME